MAGRRPSGLNRSSLPSTPETPHAQIPNLNKDPVWSLKPWPVDISFAGRSFTIPELYAIDWLVYLMQPIPDLDQLITDLLPGVEDLVYERELPLNDLYDLCLEVIATVSARPWWVAIRQIQVAYASWHILGVEMAHTDPTKVSLALWLDVLLVVTISSMDPKDVTMFTLKLEAIPTGFGKETVAKEMEMPRDSFLSLSRQ